MCKLKRALYGLKQAPRVWYQTLSDYLEANGFERLIKDRCVFIKEVKGGICIISVYVDDLLIFGSNMEIINVTK